MFDILLWENCDCKFQFDLQFFNVFCMVMLHFIFWLKSNIFDETFTTQHKQF